MGRPRKHAPDDVCEMLIAATKDEGRARDFLKMYHAKYPDDSDIVKIYDYWEHKVKHMTAYSDRKKAEPNQLNSAVGELTVQEVKLIQLHRGLI